MDNQEAIEKFKKIRGNIFLIHQRIEGKEIIEDYSLCDMAISAIEKQIPKKAVGEHYAHMRCPSCNHRIPSGAGSSSRRRDNWCNYCGQAIDWMEDE